MIKRDLFKDGFTAEDFEYRWHLDIYEREEIADLANALLREAIAQAQTVSSDVADTKRKHWGDPLPGDTHTAKLVAIKAIDDGNQGDL